MNSPHRLRKEDVVPAAGRDIDAWCTRCKEEMGHTISAMVGTVVAQVRCNTCGSTHKYRSGTTKATATGSTPRSRVAAAAATSTAISKARARHRERVAELDASTALAYSPRIQTEAGQLVRHVKFGLGIVAKVADGKALVAFEEGDKLLVVGR